MANFFRNTWIFIKGIYQRAERAALGNIVNRSTDLYEHAKAKLIFDYAFYYTMALIPVTVLAIVTSNEVNLIVIPFLVGMLFICLVLLRNGVSAKVVGALTSLTTLVMPILSSFFNNQDISPKYATIWIVSILFCYITANLLTAVLWSTIIVAYLALVAYIKLNGISLYVSSGFSNSYLYISNPIVITVYLLFIIRSMGMYYQNVISMERKRTQQQQKQQLSLIHQHLTKQFMLVKGFSRSGRTAFQNGELELLEACFTEIEKQCGIAINYLDESSEQKHNGENYTEV
ncbi:hypothetical protein SAMN05444266_102370 [Chitinophaga jiangningensis]|uniref:Uncharacterized protein n=1 Tax=Chitinophaga jiangningensis TaxID=1419482 RepID=A0A1M6YKX7_9BACT|nr:hypothetical protein [Chitinophaga jiangningensis]SHL18964.1 hypothetical protein SAMN05444266_102370 [Chitinophaga jiangningensis]